MSLASQSAEAPRVELTVRGVILGIAITLLFTAANVYLGLKMGLTFATSIPAAVISMALLRGFKNSSIYENNIVQTVASAAGAMASVIFVLPALVMVGWWTGFPFWMTFGICGIGGVLGVMYTIPLRRALVTESDLPYPEGVAGAEVLKVGSGLSGDSAEAAADGRLGFVAISVGSVVSALFAAVVATRAFASDIAAYWRIGPTAATGIGASMSLALIGGGHLMGIAVGVAMLAGLVLTWGVCVPLLTHLYPSAGAAADVAQAIWHTKVRFLGVGAIGVAAIWTLIKLVGPVASGLASAMAAQRRRSSGDDAALPRTERDMPVLAMAGVSIACLIPMAWLVMRFLQGGPMQALTLPLTIAALVYIVVAGFAVAAVCGYMAGLVGSSNSPVSGLAILAVLGAALMLAAVAKPMLHGGDTKPLVAFALLVTSILLAVAVSANDNLQDLKTGQLVDATPWRQQVALVIGVIAGSAVIPPILAVLNKAYGFAGTGGAIAANPLPAPQATLMASLAGGVIQGGLDWGLIGIGGLIGAALVAVDSLLRRSRRYSLPPLAVAIAIYLPAGVIVPSVIGAVGGWVYDRIVEKRSYGATAKRLGILMVSGLIVGESLFNVALAGLIVARGDPAPLALVPEDFAAAMPLALAAFAATIVGLYIWTARRAKRG